MVVVVVVFLVVVAVFRGDLKSKAELLCLIAHPGWECDATATTTTQLSRNLFILCK